MARNEAAIYLITQFSDDGSESARLVNAPSRSKAQAHVVAVNKASAEDVARVLGRGGKVEEAQP